ncbi:hypothetical protein BPS13_0160 [Bacillus phage BPS13]|uniref:Uncharacterized protein n=1 Tax=Bacillus phage BPS13 TaxID=1136731 RepID=J9PV03_9CAUD|nr:hypothetical protein BPS13_0160 [Bacillus phage BPS13]AEZ50339.1 hypothetical protein BPS13_0160 [Bacillus phage BPS13]
MTEEDKLVTFWQIFDEFKESTGMTHQEALDYVIAELKYDLKCKER